jgi:hypothetical protein
MLNWAKNTEWGLQAMNKGLAVTKQLLQDIMAGTTGKGNLKEAARIAESMSVTESNRTKDEFTAAKMESEIKQLQVQAAATTFLTEKKTLLGKAIQKEAELKEFLHKQAVQERDDAYAFWGINLGNVDAKNKYFEAAKKVLQIEGMDSRLLMSQYTAVVEQQTKRALDLAEAFADVEVNIEDLKKAYGDGLIAKYGQTMAGVNIGTNPSGSIQKYGGYTKGQSGLVDAMASDMAAGVEDLSYGLTDVQKNLLDLAGQFSGFFSDVNLGFQGMIDGLITGLKRLVMELISKTAILLILSAITGGGFTIGTALKAVAGGMSGGMIGSGGGGLTSAAPTGSGGMLSAEISADKLKFILENRTS